MRMAVLEAGRAAPQARSRLGGYGDMFASLLQSPGIDWEVVGVAGGEFPARVDDYDGYLITGSKYSVYDDKPWIHQLLDFIREIHAARRRLAGICFGAQAVALALGGAVELSPGGWEIGIREVRLTAEGRNYPGLSGAPDPIRILEIHQDVVTRLPPGAIHLGSSPNTRHEIFSLGPDILAVQGHPEFDAPVIHELVTRMEPSLTPRESQAARASLAPEPHQQFLRTWVLEFLTGPDTKPSASTVSAR